MITAFVVGVLVGVLSTLAVEYGFKVMTETAETPEESIDDY
jgi:hypothetical protein